MKKIFIFVFLVFSVSLLGTSLMLSVSESNTFSENENFNADTLAKIETLSSGCFVFHSSSKPLYKYKNLYYYEKRGFSSELLFPDLLENNSYSAESYKEYKKWRKMYNVFYVSTVIIPVGFPIVNSLVNNKTNGYLATAAAFLFAEVFLFITDKQKRKYEKESVEQYNLFVEEAEYQF